MKNPFRKSIASTERAQPDIALGLARRMRNPDYWLTLRTKDNKMRISVRERGRGSLLKFHGTFTVIYIQQPARSLITFRLYPSVFDAAFFATFLLFLVPWQGKITDKPWLAGHDMSPWLVLFPIAALVGMKLWGAINARSEMTRLLIDVIN